MPNQFFSVDGDLEEVFISEQWIIDQYIGDQLWTWGATLDGELGNGVTSGVINISTPITTFAGGNNWVQVSTSSEVSFSFSAGIKSDGTLWVWGNSANGSLGNANMVVVSTPITTFLGGTNWKQVSCGMENIVSIKTDGTLWLWGGNSYGQLGNSSFSLSSTPITTLTGGTNWKQVSCGKNTVTAIKTDGTLWGWGNSNAGQVGSSYIGSHLTPVTTFVGGTNWKQVSCSYRHTAAVKTDGTLWIWGLSLQGVLGNSNSGSYTTYSTPTTTFIGGTAWKQVSCGFYHTAAIKTDGTLWLWGNGVDGALGNSSNVSPIIRSTPVTTFLGGTNWKQVSCGYKYTAAIKKDGTLWLWGQGNNGKLGTGSVASSSIPVTTFVGGNDWKQVSAGRKHTAAITMGISPDLPL
jgi:alpha-tubulin suppressor-like RCC1 family protein